MFKIGADVYTTDGRAGLLTQVLTDRLSGDITHLIVNRSFLKKSDRVVPVQAVAQNTPYRIRLNINSAELDQLPQYGDNPFITEGMLVTDRAGQPVGTVKLVYPGGASDVAITRALRAAQADARTADASRSTFGNAELPPEAWARMLRQGYMRIEGPGISGANNYVMPDQIFGVAGNRIQLYASRDELLKPVK